ncbi:MAG: ABC transporter substrate-binding protein [Deinococcota bacterium]
MYNGLVGLDREVNPVPELAERWEVRDNAKTYIFYLRKGVFWHDGKPFTAEDVRFTFDLLKARPELSNQANLVKDYVERIETPDPYTAVFRFRRPAPDFLEQVLGWEKIVPAHIWGKVDNPLGYQGPDRYVGTGPFRVREYRRGEYYLFEANPDYFAGQPKVTQLILRGVANPVLALRQNEVDAASLPPRLAKEFSGQTGFLLTPPQPSYYYTKLVFNTARTPTNRREFRQALAYGINRERLIQQVLQGDGILGSPGSLHPESPWFVKSLPSYPYNPEKALALLARLGYRRQGAKLLDPQGKEAFLPLFCRGQDNARGCALVKEDLERLGFQTELRVLETAPMEEVLSKGEFILAYDGHGGTFNFFQNPDFPARIYKNTQYDQLYRAFTESKTPGDRLRAAGELQGLLAEDLPALPLYHPLDQAVYRDKAGVQLFWTRGGLAGRGGPPSFYNKLAFLEVQQR